MGLDRKTIDINTIEEPASLKFLYENPFGRILLKIATLPVFSVIAGTFLDSGLSKGFIKGFIEKNRIDMYDYGRSGSYKSFNDFFTRKIKPGKRPVDMDPKAFISPCDSKLLVYKIDSNTGMNIKGREYTVDEILGGTGDAQEFKDGIAMVFRLTVDDYHRYCFPDSGSVLCRKSIKGKLHTVSPVSKDHKIYHENTRDVSILKTDNVGTMAYIEVGAMLVGRIVDEGIGIFAKGQEKGHFEPGGSTVIILANNIKIDEDIMEQSVSGIETKVRYGERIGTAL